MANGRKSAFAIRLPQTKSIIMLTVSWLLRFLPWPVSRDLGNLLILPAEGEGGMGLGKGDAAVIGDGLQFGGVFTVIVCVEGGVILCHGKEGEVHAVIAHVAEQTDPLFHAQGGAKI